jgi:hypothetical protein
MESVSDAEVASLLVNEGPASHRESPAASVQSSDMPVGGSVQTPGGASVGRETLELMPPATVTEALPVVTVAIGGGVGVELCVALEVGLGVVNEDGAAAEPTGEKTVGGGPRSLELRAQAPPSIIAAAQAVIETLLRMARSPGRRL